MESSAAGQAEACLLRGLVLGFLVPVADAIIVLVMSAALVTAASVRDVRLAWYNCRFFGVPALQSTESHQSLAIS